MYTHTCMPSAKRSEKESTNQKLQLGCPGLPQILEACRSWYFLQRKLGCCKKWLASGNERQLPRAFHYNIEIFPDCFLHSFNIWRVEFGRFRLCNDMRQEPSPSLWQFFCGQKMGHKGGEHESVFFLGREREGREEDKMSRNERKEERGKFSYSKQLSSKGISKEVLTFRVS